MQSLSNIPFTSQSALVSAMHRDRPRPSTGDHWDFQLGDGPGEYRLHLFWFHRINQGAPTDSIINIHEERYGEALSIALFLGRSPSSNTCPSGGLSPAAGEALPNAKVLYHIESQFSRRIFVFIGAFTSELCLEACQIEPECNSHVEPEQHISYLL